MSWTTPRTWVALETVTASLMNTHVRDNLNWLAAAGTTAWTAYTPTWTGTGSNPAIGNGTLAGVYTQSAKLVVARFLCLAGSTTTFGTGTYAWALPVTLINTGSLWPVGAGVVADSGGNTYFVYAYGQSTTTTRLRYSTSALTDVLQTAPMTWATSDFAHVELQYEAA